MNLGVSRQVRMNEWCELILWMTDVYIHTLSATIYRRQSMRLTWRQETQTWLQVCYFKCDHFRVFEIPRLDSLLLLLFFLISRSLFFTFFLFSFFHLTHISHFTRFSIWSLQRQNKHAIWSEPTPWTILSITNMCLFQNTARHTADPEEFYAKHERIGKKQPCPMPMP